MVGPHAFGMLGRGFQTMTVPALKIDGRRVQGSREIARARRARAATTPVSCRPAAAPGGCRSRALGRGAPGRGPADLPVRRAARAARVSQRSAPRQPADAPGSARLAAVRHAARDRRTPRHGLRRAGGPRRARRALGSDRRMDRAGPPRRRRAERRRLQIAPNVAMLLCFADLAPFIESRAAARLAHRVAPDHPGQIGAVLPTAWLAPLGAGASPAPQRGPRVSQNVSRAVDRRDHWTTRLLSSHSAPIDRRHHG